MYRFKNVSRIAVALSMAMLVTACATYYKVKDPATGNVYYTDKVKRASSGAVTFKDARSNAEVTIQNSEVTEISKGDYTAGITAPATPAPAAAPEAEPAPAPE
jgi:hypothetical protein